ncbi:class B sortase [Clostridium perfringens]|uniref:class B sortase n=1 Tax=Clostridium culturomicium TaxID=1499683 RepID=UPI00058EC0DF|nr:class B sortase [Clostridium culturomicium]
MKKFINIILLIILIFSLYKVIYIFKEYITADNIYTELQIEKENLISNNNILDLTNINEDYIGWIEIPNTNISYPIVQSIDNDYYLDKDIYKNELSSGSIFLDYRNNNFFDSNSILYGHAMKNNTMFGDLKKFKEKYFFEENKIITITKPNGEILKYKIFSVYVSNINDNYTQNYFYTSEEYKEFLNKILRNSLFLSNEDLHITDKILTLSTCSFESEISRLVVHAKLIDIS